MKKWTKETENLLHCVLGTCTILLDYATIDKVNFSVNAPALVNNWPFKEHGCGSLIDDDAILDALDSGIVSGATLDGFKIQPLPRDHGYWKHPNVLITPHIAAKTRFVRYSSCREHTTP